MRGEAMHMNEALYLPPGVDVSEISRPEPQDVVAERTVELTVALRVRQEFETRNDDQAKAVAKGDVRLCLGAEAPEIEFVEFLDESVSSVRQNVGAEG